MATGHHLRLFGSVELLQPDGYPIRFRTRKHLALLVYLALEARDRLIDRSQLVDLFWGGVAYDKGSHSLAQALTAIRSALGPRALTRFKHSVQLLAGVTTDLDSFAPRAFRAEDLSSPLPQLEGCGGPSFGLWIETVRGRCLADIRRRLVADLAEARRGGLVQEAWESATLLHAVDPTNELAALVVAEHMAADGDLDGAISLLRRHVSHTKEELSRSPSLELTGFLQRLERGLFRTLGDPEAESEGLPLRGWPEVFVGRERQLTRLESLWTRARDGRLVTALVVGPGGIGKSTLARRFATGLAARGWPAYLVSCQEIDGAIPFAAVSELTLQLARDPAAAGTDPQWLGEASRVTPGLRSVYTGIPEPQPTPAEAVRLRAAEALFRMLEAVRDAGPLLLAIDDVHFMDPASRQVIHVLARRLERSPTLLLATADDGESRQMRHEADDLVAWQEDVLLESLDQESTRRLVRAVAGRGRPTARHVCDKIVELSQGNPYLTEMLLSDWHNNRGNSLVAAEMDPLQPTAAWRPSRAMRRAFKRQHEGLSRSSEHMLNLLAVAGRAIAATDLRDLLDLEQSEMDRAVLELVNRSTIRVLGGAFGFRNEPHRAFVYFRMPQEARIYYHARLADSLMATGTEGDFQRYLEASHHFVKAGMVNDAVDAVCAGADLAVTRGAPKEAERALQQVLCICPVESLGRVRLLLARALSGQQRFQESLSQLSCLEERLEPREVALMLTLEAEALHKARLAESEKIRDVATSAIQWSQMAENDLLTLAAQQVLAETAFENEWWDKIPELEAFCEKLAKTTESTEIRALAQYTFGYCRFASGDIKLAASSFAQSSREFSSLGHDPRLHRALNGLGMCYTRLGYPKQAVTALQEAVLVAHRSSDLIASSNSLGNIGAVYSETGMFYEAARAFARALRILGDSTNARVSTAVHCNAAILSIMLGSMREATELLDRASATAERSAIWQHSVSVLLTRADFYLALQQQERAWDLVEQALIVAAGRTHLVPDYGQFCRLRKHFVWSVGRDPSARTHGVDTGGAGDNVAPAHRLELMAFDEWLLSNGSNGTDTPNTAVKELADRGLYGVIARLASVFITPHPLPCLAEGECGAAFLARVFPTKDFGSIPSSIGETSEDG